MTTLVGVTPTSPAVAANPPNLIDQMIATLPYVLIIVAIIVVVILILRFFNRNKEARKDLYELNLQEVIEQCKLLKTKKYLKPILGLPTWMVSKGVPIVINYPTLVYKKNPYDFSKDSNEREKERAALEGETIEDTLITRPSSSYIVGSYAGHCETMDGCINILVKSRNNKTMFIFPRKFVIKLRDPIIQKQMNMDRTIQEADKIAVPADSFSMSEDMIVVNAFGLQKIGKFHYAVNKDRFGNVVDTRSYIYTDQINIALQKQVMDLGRNISAMAEEYMRGNSLVQFMKKTGTDLASTP